MSHSNEQYPTHWTGPRLNWPAVLTVMVLLVGQIGAVFWWASMMQHQAGAQSSRITRVEQAINARAAALEVSMVAMQKQYDRQAARFARIEARQQINSGVLRNIWRAVRDDGGNTALSALSSRHALARLGATP